MFSRTLIALLLALMAPVASAQQAVDYSQYTVDELLMVFSSQTLGRDYGKAYRELKARADEDRLDFSESGDAINWLARTFVTSAEPDPFARVQNMQAPNACRSHRPVCARALQLVADSVPLLSHQVDSLSAAAAVDWDKLPENAQYYLEVLEVVAKNQPLTEIASRRLVDMALSTEAKPRSEEANWLRDVIVQAGTNENLHAGELERLLQGLPLKTRHGSVERYTRLYVNDAALPGWAGLHTERFLLWVNHPAERPVAVLLGAMHKDWETWYENESVREELLGLIVRVRNERLIRYLHLVSLLPRSVATSDLELTALTRIAVGAKPAGATILREVRRQLSDRIRRNEAIPSANLQEIVTPIVPAYSETLSEDEMNFASAAISLSGYLARYEPVPEVLVDKWLAWFRTNSWGGEGLVAAAADHGLGSLRAQALFEFAIDPNVELTSTQQSYLDKLVRTAPLPTEIYTWLGEWLMAPANAERRGTVLQWLYSAWRQGFLPSESVAARSLVFHADHFSNARMLEPILSVHADDLLLDHLAGLAVTQERENLLLLISSTDLPTPVVKKLEPLLRSDAAPVAQAAVDVYSDNLSIENGGPEWFLEKSLDANTPMGLRIESIRRLQGSASDPTVRAGLLQHLESPAEDIRLAALQSMHRVAIEKARLSALTTDPNLDIQREAWRQLDKHHQVRTPLKERWRLYPWKLRDDIAGVILVAAIFTGIIGGLSFLAAAWASGSWLKGTLIVVGGAISTVVAGAVFLLSLLGMHGGGFGQMLEIWGATLVIYWLLIFGSWIIVYYGLKRERRAGVQAATL